MAPPPKHGEEQDEEDDALDRLFAAAQAQAGRELRRLEQQRTRSKQQQRPNAASVERPLPPSNKGAVLLKRMGFREGQGLGAQQQGITEPLLVQPRQPRTGLGVAERQREEKRRAEEQARARLVSARPLPYAEPYAAHGSLARSTPAHAHGSTCPALCAATRLQQEEAKRREADAQEAFRRSQQAAFAARKLAAQMRQAWAAAENLERQRAQAQAATSPRPPGVERSPLPGPVEPAASGGSDALPPRLAALLAEAPALRQALVALGVLPEEEEQDQEAHDAPLTTAAAAAGEGQDGAQQQEDQEEEEGYVPLFAPATKRPRLEERAADSQVDDVAGDRGCHGGCGTDVGPEPGSQGGSAAGQAAGSGAGGASGRGTEAAATFAPPAAVGGGSGGGGGPLEAQREQLAVLLRFLRARHLFCPFCGVAYSSAEELEQQCPGMDEDLHA